MTRYNVPLFYPYISEEIRQAAYNALGDKIIGQGKKVADFEKLLSKTLGINNILTVNSGTSALEIAYHLLDLKPGDEVITPVFTFIGTNIPLVRRKVKIVFADIKDNLLLDWSDAEKKITPKTKAIVNVHLFGQMSESENLEIPVVGDAAQYLGKTQGERFTAYSFQATKILTTVDGGALACKNSQDFKRVRNLRWFGINRENGKSKVFADVKEAGFKYHMSDVTASLGIAGLKNLSKLKKERVKLEYCYHERLKNIDGIKVEGGSPFLIHVPNREKLMTKLASMGIESGQAGLYRNDIYSIFGGKRQNLPNMNRLEKSYLLLPCHNKMSLENVEFICKALKESM